MPRRECRSEGAPAALPASDALGHVRRPPSLRLCYLLPALVSPLFLPLISLLPILLSLILTLESCILILLRLPITPEHHPMIMVSSLSLIWRAGREQELAS